MRRLFATLFFAALATRGFSEQIGSQFVQSLLRFDFERSYHYLPAVDSDSASREHLEFVIQLLKNYGQKPLDDRIRHMQFASKPLPENYSYNLMEGVFLIFNDPGNGEAFSRLTNALVLAGEDEERQKLVYFFILILYEQEIVQSSDNYFLYLEKYKMVAKTELDFAWWHIHYVRYILKIQDRAKALSLYDEAMDGLNGYLQGKDWPLIVQAYYLYVNAIYQRNNSENDKALELYQQVAELPYEIAALRYLKFTGLIHQCKIYSDLGDFDEAGKVLELSRNYWNRSDSVRSAYIYNRHSAVWYYAKVGAFDSAYKALRTSTINERKLDFRRNTLKISELNVLLESTQRENELLEAEKTVSSQKQWLSLTAVFLTMAMALASVAWVSARRIRGKNKKIETLMKELHHRVKNNLQVISSLLGLQSMKLQDEAAKRAVVEGKGRIRAMSLIHQKLYQDADVTSIDIREYLDNLIQELVQSYGMAEKLKTSVQAPKLAFDADRALPLGLIVNELVSNSLKYAFADVTKPELRIDLKEIAPGKFDLKVKDNGPGLPENLDLENLDSFGMRLVKILIKQLKGTLQLRNDLGLVVEIGFKI